MFDQARKAAGIVSGLKTRCGILSVYHLAHFKNAASTAMECGHHDSRICSSHYRELVRPKEADRYWRIRPVATKKVVAFKA